MPVVVAVDDDPDEELLLEAERLATDRGQRLDVVHVIGESEFRRLEETSIKETGQPIDLDVVRDYSKSVADDAASGTISEYEPVGLEGEEAARIVQYVSKVDADYVVIGGHKRSPVGKAMFGSVSQSVLLNADCPVLLVKST